MGSALWHEETIAQLDLNSADATKLRSAVRHVGPDCRIRALVSVGLARLLTGTPREAELKRRFSHLPAYNPFSYMPLDELIYRVAFCARALYPELPLEVGTQTLTERLVEDFNQTSFARPMLMAAEGSFTRFVQMSATLPNFFDDYSQLTVERLAPRQAVLRYDNTPAIASGEYVLVGFWRGMMKAFGLRGEIAQVTLGPRSFDHTLSW